MEKPSEKTIAITATFTGEPVGESLDFWARELGIPLRIEFAPYGRVFQQLLAPSGLIRGNQNSINVTLLPVQD